MNGSSRLPSSRPWTHPSVRALFGDSDPVAAIIAAARDVVVSALDEGWEGPPFDPIRLADLRGVPVSPRDDVFDARLVTHDAGIQIEYNPNRPPGRRRFSVAHELAHTLFPDHGEATRNRARVDRATSDDWQLEVLCNLAAAEFVMPIGSFRQLGRESLELRDLLRLRQQFGVSTEAILLRAAHLHHEPIAVFAASQRADHDPSQIYRVDYVVPSGGWDPRVSVGAALATSAVAECTAIGYTVVADEEEWPGIGGKVHVEAVGIPPYPGHILPRVVGLITPARSGAPTQAGITYLFGDATEPRGSGPRVIAHIANNRARQWRGGFSASLRRRWPFAAADFSSWVDADRSRLGLGAVHTTHLEPDIWTATLIAQVGYGPSKSPRVRYAALRAALRQLASFASQHTAKVQMPRIGSGQAGGDWSIIADLIEDELSARGIAVAVFDLPGQIPPVAGDIIEVLGRERR